MKSLAAVAFLLIAGCGRGEHTTQSASIQTSSSLAPLDNQLAQSFLDQNPPRFVAPTARTIQRFRHLKNGMTRREVTAIVGKSDEDVGSGLYVDIYRLSDGSTVSLGSGDCLIYAYHKLKNGKSYDLLDGGVRKQ